MKVELLQLGDDHEPDQAPATPAQFMSRYAAIRSRSALAEGRDLTVAGIEVGSYGRREAAAGSGRAAPVWRCRASMLPVKSSWRRGLEPWSRVFRE
jgi:hypothetical protein